MTPRSAVLTTTTHVPEAEAALCAPLASRHVQEPHLRLAGASAALLPVGHARPPAAAHSAVAGLLLFGSSGLSPSPQKTCSGRGLALGLSTISVKTALVERKRPLVRALPRLGRRSRRPRVACWALVRGSLVRARSLSRPWTSQPLSPAHSDGAPSRPFSPRALVLVAALASADSCCSAAPLLARPVRRRPSCASSSCRVRACDAAPLATEVRHRLRLRLAWSPRAPLSPLRLSLTLRGTDVRSPPSVRRPPSCVPSRPRVRACSMISLRRDGTRSHLDSPRALVLAAAFRFSVSRPLMRSAAPLFDRCALVRRPPSCPLRRSLASAFLWPRFLSVASPLRLSLVVGYGFHPQHAVGGLATPRQVSRALVCATGGWSARRTRRLHALCTSIGARESARPSTLSSFTLGLSRVSCHPPHLCIGMSRCSFVSSLTDPLYSRPNVSVHRYVGRAQ